MEQSSPICNTSLLQFLIHRYFCYWFLLLLLYNLCDLGCGYLTHRVTWLIDHEITWYAKKSFISTFARTMATNFSKVWLKLSWPQPSSHVTHLSCDHVIFAKRCSSSFTTPMTIKLGRVMSQGEGIPPTLSSNLSIKWSRAFRET